MKNAVTLIVTLHSKGSTSCGLAATRAALSHALAWKLFIDKITAY